ncbi:hypothetical protein CP500_018615 [Tychonema bourrellyi FEM_GT703]|uniref:Uncharacterized protein n=1 Tax=Tychonema bourrellyi FEM_GT703 TaxID=2040638 RepID=A0A2G4EXU8_9CYAN|nr:hypothetical protein CP500_018615 [Tychonema bourrellyi FEM_GT703]
MGFGLIPPINLGACTIKKLLIIRFEILDFGFSIDPTDKFGGLKILDFGFWIDSTDKSGGLYHQEIIG